MGSLRKLAGPRAEDGEERGEAGRARSRGRSGPLRTSKQSASAASQDEHAADQRTVRALVRKQRECGQPRDHLRTSLTLRRAGPHKQAARTSERLSRTYISFGITLAVPASWLCRRSTDAAACLSHPIVILHHGRLVGPAHLAVGTPTRSRRARPARLSANHRQLALNAPIPRPAAREVQSTVAVLAIPARPRQCRPMRGAAAVWYALAKHPTTHFTLPFPDIDAPLVGSPCRVGPNLLLTDDADLVRHMNAPGSKWTRSGWYDGVRLDPRYDSVFSARDEKLHADLRAKEIGAVGSSYS